MMIGEKTAGMIKAAARVSASSITAGKWVHVGSEKGAQPRNYAVDRCGERTCPWWARVSYSARTTAIGAVAPPSTSVGITKPTGISAAIATTRDQGSNPN